MGVTTSQEVAGGVSTAGAVTGAVLALVGATSAIPIVGAAVAGVTALISVFGIGNGCGSTCTLSTQVVNQVEPLMQQNLQAAQSQLSQNGGCLTQAEAQQLEQNFNALWQQVIQGCTQVGGAGGSQCISDRQPGGKYDWTSYYLTPIKNMPVCVAATGGDGKAGIDSTDSVLSSLESASVGGFPFLPIAAVALIGFALMGGK